MMKGTASVQMNVITFDAQHQVCGKCQQLLDIHQPNTEDTDRLLGTCGSCGSWFMIDLLSEESDQAVQVALPDRRRTLQAAS